LGVSVGPKRAAAKAVFKRGEESAVVERREKEGSREDARERASI
jgi:hypothetical protein